MKIIFIDIDTLRPDHLGCYGYHRSTSPNIDRLASHALRFDNVFVPDAPCLPSRSALHHGRFGIHNGAINHGGTYADPYREGASRGFNNSDPYKKWVQVLRDNGYFTTTVSSFAGRHDSWWFLAGFNEVYDCGKGGMERQDEVIEHGITAIERNKDKENWFFHFNIWDPHTPYRVPDEYGNPFENDPPPSWMNQEIIDSHQTRFGTHSATLTLHSPANKPTAREVSQIKNMTDYKKWVDGYDCGIRYADDAVGRIMEKLEELNLYKDCAVILSSDHGENQGELNVYGDHQTADIITCRVPMLLKWPGMKSGVRKALHYQFDISATLLDLLDISIPAKWDALSIKDQLEKMKDSGRDFLVVSQAAWSCQRAVIWDDYILIKTYDDGLKEYPELMLFNWKEDPHETTDLSASHPELVDAGLARLNRWFDEMTAAADYKEDPMQKVIEEGGPFHPAGRLQEYLDYYAGIGRDDIVKKMKDRYTEG
jgi:arylsulfatase A-like enzyme